MNKGWDDLGEGQAMQASHEAWLLEAYRVLKPGGTIRAFSGTRTHHRLAAAMESVGLGVEWGRNWVHGQGFAKGTDISKGIDKVKGAKRKVVGHKRGVGGENLNDIVRGKGKVRSTKDKGGKGVGAYGTGAKQVPVDVPITEPATPEAKKWEGWKTGLSPNWEPVLLGTKAGNPELQARSSRVVWLVRKPPVGSIVRNTLEHGCGGINVDGCRISTSNADDIFAKNPHTKGGFGHANAAVYGTSDGAPSYNPSKGRWPKNVILMHKPGCVMEGVVPGKGYQINRWSDGAKPFGGGAGHEYESEHVTELTAQWKCDDDCAVEELDGQSGYLKTGRVASHSDSGGLGWSSGADIDYADQEEGGGASRFFHQEQWKCDDDCPVDELDTQSGTSSSKFTPPRKKKSPFRSSTTWETEGRRLRDGVSDAPINYGDAGGASRYFHQDRGSDGLPTSLLGYLKKMVSPPDGVFVMLHEDDMEEIDWSSAKDMSVHAMLIVGNPGGHVAEIVRVLKPGAHLLVVAPDEQLTGHTAACAVEDAGLEIRDSILLVSDKSFLYTAKAGPKERHSGVTERLRRVETEKEVEDEDGEVQTVVEVVEKRWCNNHPTVKPVGMMEALLKEIPTDHLVVDPFLGSGTTAVAALRTGHDLVGIERDPESLLIADERVRFWDAANASWNSAAIESEAPDPDPEEREATPIEAMFGFDLD